jgi:hypothetical protein
VNAFLTRPTRAYGTETTSTYPTVPKGVVAFFVYVVAFAVALFLGFPASQLPVVGLIAVTAVITTLPGSGLGAATSRRCKR